MISLWLYKEVGEEVVSSPKGPNQVSRPGVSVNLVVDLRPTSGLTDRS
jgi:hypothetical protein